MKTKEELLQLKEEYQTVTAKLKELSDDELKIVTGGARFLRARLSGNVSGDVDFNIPTNDRQYEQNLYFITESEKERIDFE